MWRHISIISALLAALLASPVWADSAEKSVPHATQYPVYPTINYGMSAKAEQIKRGEYLVKAGDCIACHTAENGPVFAGGLPVKTPFGTIYGPNITPDKETGIGSWTDEQFVRAMREGKRADGRHLYPVFPYLYYNKLSEQDILDIRAYLNAIPAVHKKSLPVDMPWPFSWRFTQLGWKILFFEFYKGEFKPEPKQSAAWNRGAYLVQGLGHCAMCHTPINLLGAPKRKYNLTGGFVDGYYAPNISESNLGNTPVQEIVDVFLKDELIGGGKVQGPMLEVNHDSLKYLKEEDLQAIAIYLKTVKSASPPKAKSSGGHGGDIYESHCAMCHATGANGSPKFGDAQAWDPIVKEGISVVYSNAINGIKGMPAKGACSSCSSADIQAAVDYMVAATKGGGSSKPKGKPLPKLTIMDGKNIYEGQCAVCHSDNWQSAPQLGQSNAWQPLVAQGVDVLFVKTVNTHKNIPGCKSCQNGADLMAAIKYILQQSVPGNYTLW